MTVMKDIFYLNIDVVGNCNLKCPSCPVGNWGEFSQPQKSMSTGLLSRILDKAKEECVVSGVGLFNWTEPLLHPDLAGMVKIVQDKGIKCSLSSNLNITKNLSDVLSVNPSSFRISLSGFSQSVYSKTHRGGGYKKSQEKHANSIKVKEGFVIFN